MVPGRAVPTALARAVGRAAGRGVGVVIGRGRQPRGAGDNAHPAGIVVDQKHVYWVNTGFYANTGELKRTDLDGQNEVTLLTGLPSPVMLADDDGGRLFFISGALGAPAVYKAIKPAS